MTKEINSYAIKGELNGQQLWKQLTPDEQKMSSAWCHPTGNAQNKMRALQLQQMLRKYLARAYPRKPDQAADRLDSKVEWSGDTNGVIKLRVRASVPEAKSILAKLYYLLKSHTVVFTAEYKDGSFDVIDRFK